MNKKAVSASFFYKRAAVGAGSLLLPGLRIGKNVFVKAGPAASGQIESESVVRDAATPVVFTDVNNTGDI